MTQVRIGDLQLGVGDAVVTIVVGCELDVVAGEEVFRELPGELRLDERDVTGFLQLRCDLFKIFPGLRSFDAGLLEGFVVDIHDRRGSVERHADELAVSGSVEIADAVDEGFAVELVTGLVDEVFCRNDSALGVDDGGSASIENLENVRLFARTESSDAACKRFFV
ncbi:hypothetical protein QE432_002987 [Agrobacterium sp. SORGH_AS 745]|nr:hypothetical protein [Agrobacterium sp. SORGH_AS_0745]